MENHREQTYGHGERTQLGAPLQAYNQVSLDISSQPLPSPWTPRPRLRATWRHAKSSTDTFSGNFKVGDILRRSLGCADFLKNIKYLAALCLSCGMWHLRASCGIQDLQLGHENSQLQHEGSQFPDQAHCTFLWVYIDLNKETIFEVFSDLYNRIIEKLTKKGHLELTRVLVRIKNSIGKTLKD